MRLGEEYDDTLRPAAAPQTATPGMFCNPCMAAGRAGRVAHRVIYKSGRPYGLCNDCYRARQEAGAAALRTLAAPSLKGRESSELARQVEALDDTVEDLDDHEELYEEEERPKKEGKVGAPRLDEEIIKKIVSEYEGGLAVSQIADRRGLTISAVYGRLRAGGAKMRSIGDKRGGRPAQAARLPRQPRPSSRALARVDHENGRGPLVPAEAPAAAAPERSNGAAHIRFRVIECEIGAGNETLTEGIRALTEALQRK